MKRKEMVGSLIVYSSIYDVDLPAKVLQEMEEEQLHLDPEQSYDVEILFATEVFKLDEFYAFNITKQRPAPRRKKNLSENEKKKEKMYDILGEQLDNVKKALESAGITIMNSAIIGEEYITKSFVDVVFYLLEPEPEAKGKKNSTEIHVNSIMPSRKSFYENMSKVVDEILKSQERERKEAEKERIRKEEHTPNWILAEDLFSEIAHSMYPTDYDKAIAYKEMLYSTATLVSDWPLQIKSRTKSENGTPMSKDSKLDCPEYMIYTQSTTGKWAIDKVADLRMAQLDIVHHGYNLKSTERKVVLHNSKTVPYTLFKNSDEGLVEVTPEEARGEKKLFLCWNK